MEYVKYTAFRAIPGLLQPCIAVRIHGHVYSHSTQTKCLPFSGAGIGLESFFFIYFSQGNDFVKDFQVLEAFCGKLIHIQKFPVGMWYMAMVKEHF